MLEGDGGTIKSGCVNASEGAAAKNKGRVVRRGSKKRETVRRDMSWFRVLCRMEKLWGEIGERFGRGCLWRGGKCERGFGCGRWG